MAIVCNQANTQLSDQEWQRIEKVCQQCGHIANIDHVKEIIDNDEKTLQQLGITFQQLTDFFQKFKSHLYKKTNDSSYECLLTEPIKKELGKYHLGDVGWSCWGSIKASIFQDQLIVIKVTWGGAELCPFQSPEDHRYHGYEYGSHDWIFVNTQTLESMHIGDLLFHQISVHHFFQGPSSQYRVDPERLVKFFHIQPNINYETDFHSFFYWNEYSSSTCRRQLYPDTIYTEKDAYDQELLSTPNITRLKFDNNIIYHTTDKAMLIINTPKAKYLPTEINGWDYRETLSRIIKYDTIGIIGLELRKLREITDEEEKKKWF